MEQNNIGELIQSSFEGSAPVIPEQIELDKPLDKAALSLGLQKGATIEEIEARAKAKDEKMTTELLQEILYGAPGKSNEELSSLLEGGEFLSEGEPVTDLDEDDLEEAEIVGDVSQSLKREAPKASIAPMQVEQAVAESMPIEDEKDRIMREVKQRAKEIALKIANLSSEPKMGTEEFSRYQSAIDKATGLAFQEFVGRQKGLQEQNDKYASEIRAQQEREKSELAAERAAQFELMANRASKIEAAKRAKEEQARLQADLLSGADELNQLPTTSTEESLMRSLEGINASAAAEAKKAETVTKKTGLLNQQDQS